MNKSLQLLYVLFIFACVGGSAVASPTLSLVPSTSKIHPPESFYVDVVMSGLQHNDASTLLGAFDLTILYEPNIVTLLIAGSTLGTGLGDPTDPLQTVVGANASSPGSFRFFELSLLETSSTTCVFCIGPYLQDLQSDAFTLASLFFYAPGSPAGKSFTSFVLPRNLVVLSDANGNGITTFAISNAIVAIPEPPTLDLLVAAFLTAIALRLRSSGV